MSKAVKKSVSSKPMKKSTKKAAAAPAPTPAPPAPVENVVAQPETVEAAPFSELAETMTNFQSSIQAAINQLNALKAEYRALEKKIQKEGKMYQKALAKRKKKTGNRQPSGFVKPAPISDELATFLHKEKGTEMSRTDVTKEINAYIQKHNLKDKKNGRIIHPDSKLTKLLKVGPKEELTYFNLQKYMSHHFPKSASKSS